MATPKITPKDRKRLNERGNPIEENIPDFADNVHIDDIEIFIAKRVNGKEEKFEKTVEKVRKRIDYSIKLKKLVCTKPEYLKFEDLIHWIRTKKDWAGEFTGLRPPCIGMLTATVGFSVTASGTTLPNNITECHSMLASLLSENAALLKENITQKQEIGRLIPFENKIEKRRLDGIKNGSKGKGIKKVY
jgi:hypothetical protein